MDEYNYKNCDWQSSRFQQIIALGLLKGEKDVLVVGMQIINV